MNIERTEHIIFFTFNFLIMLNLNNIHPANLNALIADLTFAWETRNDIYMDNGDVIQETNTAEMLHNATNFTCYVDPENRELMWEILAKKGNGHHSMNSLAHKLMAMK